MFAAIINMSSGGRVFPSSFVPTKAEVQEPASVALPNLNNIRGGFVTSDEPKNPHILITGFC